MATVIRFARHGKKKKPFFRLVVQDSRAKRDGRFIERIGHVNPIKENDSLVVARDRLEYWLGVGAKMSDSVRNCLKPLMRQWQQQQPPPLPPIKETGEKAKEA